MTLIDLVFDVRYAILAKPISNSSMDFKRSWDMVKILIFWPSNHNKLHHTAGIIVVAPLRKKKPKIF